MANEKIYIFDTTLRDGEQVPGCQLSTVEKIEIAKELEALGVDIIEAGFPVSSPGDFESVQEIAKATSEPIICALTRANKKDIDVAADSLKQAKHKRIHTGIGVSDYHIQYKFSSNRQDVLAKGVEAVKYAKKYVEDVEFYAEDAGRADLEYLAQVVEAVIAAGATVVNLPDTTGYCLPDQYGAKIRYLKEHVPNVEQAILSCHCHNDLGLATANAIAGIQNGVRQAEVTVNGVGERAGNTSLEEVAMILRTHQMGYDTAINPKRITPLSRLVSRLMNMPVQPNKALVGRNAFAHSSGIHQDGVLKNRENYEIISPADVGLEENSIILTARSGRAALNHHLNKLGLSPDKEELDRLYQKFLKLADQKKGITDEDVKELAGLKANANRIVLNDLQITCGNHLRAVALVTISFDERTLSSTSDGEGPVDAAVKALDRIIQKEIALNELLVQSISGGSDDFSKVHMQIAENGSVQHGFGADKDIVVASLNAYIDALNKLF